MKTLRVLAYGKPGGGKTTFALSFPKPIYVFDFDNGLPEETIYGVTSDLYYDFDIRNIPLPELAYSKFQKKWMEILTGKSKYATVILDTFTGYQDAIGNYIRKMNNWTGEIPANMTLKYYGGMSEYSIKLANDMRMLKGTNIVVTAYEQLIKDEVSGDVLSGPAMAGNKGVPKIIGSFSDMFYFSSKNAQGKGMKFETYVMQYGRYDAKTRLSITDKNGDIHHVFDGAIQEDLSYQVIAQKYDELEEKLRKEGLLNVGE